MRYVSIFIPRNSNLWNHISTFYFSINNIIIQFIFRLYSISLVAITAAAAVKGDLYAGLVWMTQPGTYQQYLDGVPLEERKWSAMSKLLIMVLFSSMGFFGSSCSAAITKNFGALTMSITSTARKATTLFLSFFLFKNVCTKEHVAGIVVFIAALTTKSVRRRNNNDSKRHRKKRDRRHRHHHQYHSNGGKTSPWSTSDNRKYELPVHMNVEPAEGLTLRRVGSREGNEERTSLVHIV